MGTCRLPTLAVSYRVGWGEVVKCARAWSFRDGGRGRGEYTKREGRRGYDGGRYVVFLNLNRCTRDDCLYYSNNIFYEVLVYIPSLVTSMYVAG